MSRTIVAGLTAFSFASAASAVEITINSSLPTITAGDTVTITIELENANAAAVTSMTGILSGLNGVGGVLTSGQASLLNFASLCGDFGVVGPQCFGAINTLGGGNYDPNDLSAASIAGVSRYQPGDDFVTLIAAVHAPGTSSDGNGSIDPGVAGVMGSHDPIDITLDIMANSAGILGFDVEFIIALDGGGQEIINSNIALTVLPVPEPEPGTALLMGLGLAGLGIAGRRK